MRKAGIILEEFILYEYYLSKMDILKVEHYDIS